MHETEWVGLPVNNRFIGFICLLHNPFQISAWLHFAILLLYKVNHLVLCTPI